MLILVINAGSSSIKYRLFKYVDQTQESLLTGIIEGITEDTGAWTHETTDNRQSFPFTCASHQIAFQALKDKLLLDLNGAKVNAVGHRVVHGGIYFHQPTLINASVLAKINELSALAPLHNPANVEGIVQAIDIFPEAIQVAVFDTGFHYSLPDYARFYPVNQAVADELQIRRYGFHGINHEYVTKQAAIFLNKSIEQCNFISLHLGNGASTCLIKGGKSVDTSMGMTPLAGLMMGTRSGDIDPSIPIYLYRQGYTVDQIEILLNKQSGLKGFAETNDMRNILELMNKGDCAAKLAVEMYVYIIQKMIGSYLPHINPIDAIIFTGGIGENASIIRSRIIERFNHFRMKLDEDVNAASKKDRVVNIAIGPCPVLVIRSNEESLIAEKTALFLEG